MTRIGKIARLPRPVREQLNRRLQDGEPGKELLKWLNALKEVRKVLAVQFSGRAITKQNLSEWKRGGYRDWERAEEAHLRVSRLVEEAADLADLGDNTPLSERLAAVLVAELAGAVEALRKESMSASRRWQRLRELLRELAQVRRDDHRRAKLHIEQERWEGECERRLREDIERAIKERDGRRRVAAWAGMELDATAKEESLDEAQTEAAAAMFESQFDLPRGTLTGKSGRSNEVKPGHGESNPVQPNQGSPRETGLRSR